jgi:NIMA (never in mitosis gene a)-related kinase
MEQNTLSYKDFEVVKELGSGSFGKVQLVRKKTDGILYAIKSVNMVRLNEKEKDSALNEVRLLASINIPYVIGFQGSFYNNENQSLCVVMEYAEGGDL